MTYTSASIQKGKKSSLGSYDQEQTRTMGEGQQTWQNPSIDATMERTHAIQVVRNFEGGSVKDAVNARLKNALGDKRIRKDAVTHLTFYATMPDYSQREPWERKQFESRVLDFLAEKYGNQNVVDCRWHFDEASPHLHATVVPITEDGRLCAKEVFKPTTRAMREWQKDYFFKVGEPMGYDQPDFGKSGEKGYTKAAQATREQIQALEATRSNLSREVEELQTKTQQEQKSFETAKKNKELAFRQCKSYAEQKGQVKKEVATLEAKKGSLADAIAAEESRLERLRRSGNSIERRIEELTEHRDQCSSRVSGLEKARGEVIRRIAKLESACRWIFQLGGEKRSERVQTLGRFAAWLGDTIQELKTPAVKEQPKLKSYGRPPRPVVEHTSPTFDLRKARAAADAYNKAHASPSRGYGHSHDPR